MKVSWGSGIHQHHRNQNGEIETLISVLVDSVSEILDLDAEHIEPSPEIGTQLNKEYLIE